MASWSFLTNHARVLLCVAHDPGVRLRDIAASLDITERSAFSILTDLAEATAAHAAEAPRGSGRQAVLVAGQAREAVTAGRAEATAANAWAESATAQAGAEPERIRADSTWQREELRQVPDGRTSVLEEARAELRARAGRAVSELDHVRAERAELGWA